MQSNLCARQLRLAQTSELLAALDATVGLAHPVEVSSRPGHHRAPFDRLLVAQALVEKLILVSRDPQLRKYAAPILW